MSQRPFRQSNLPVRLRPRWQRGRLLCGASYAGQLASRASDNGFKVDLGIRF
jgi:hypothetical protein